MKMRSSRFLYLNICPLSKETDRFSKDKHEMAEVNSALASKCLASHSSSGAQGRGEKVEYTCERLQKNKNKKSLPT